MIKNADHPVMNSGGQVSSSVKMQIKYCLFKDKYMGCSVDVIDCKQKNQSELAI